MDAGSAGVALFLDLKKPGILVGCQYESKFMLGYRKAILFPILYVYPDLGY
jgi:hypothetical protein